MEILRFATAGSVDDGKSSLIGRLLYDTKAVLDDQYASIETASRSRGLSEVQLSFLTDGLRAERDLKITIDVAYRYFATPKRRFIIADTPGHFEFTRNMVTGTSTADVSVILIDASRGIFEQSRRHIALSALLGIQHVAFAINKMDLVEYRESRYQELFADLASTAKKLAKFECAFIPISALHGDNVAERSQNMPWYDGPTLLEFLETVDISRKPSQVGLRLPIQTSVESAPAPGSNSVYYLGQLESGKIELESKVKVLPAYTEHRVTDLVINGVQASEAVSGEPVSVRLDPVPGLKRGDMVVSANSAPINCENLIANLCWVGDTPLELGKPYLLLHTTRTVNASVKKIQGRFHLETLELEPTDTVETNTIAECQIHLNEPIFADTFEDCFGTGTFLLVDATTKVTCAAGMVKSIL